MIPLWGENTVDPPGQVPAPLSETPADWSGGVADPSTLPDRLSSNLRLTSRFEAPSVWHQASPFVILFLDTR